MTAPRVFVSYSHRDEAVLQTLLPFLKTLERNNLVTVWSDQRIKGGVPWRAEIDAALDAATIAVLLISQDFLASEFVQNEELPRILEQQLAGQMTVLPVFVSPSTVTSYSVDVRDTQGNERKIVLSEFQGFGTPQQTLSELALPERQRVFVELHNRIRELATGPPVAVEAPHASTPVAVNAPPPPLPREAPPSLSSLKLAESRTPRKGCQVSVTIAAVGAVVAMVLGILQWRSLSFNDAVTQFENGSPAGITGLAEHGDKGIRVLVEALDATGDKKPALFPERTIGIIKVLHEHPKAVEKYRAALDTEAAKNREKIDSLVMTIEIDQVNNVAVNPQQVKQLENLARVAVCMNQLIGEYASDWPDLAIRVRVLLRELPTC